MKKAIFACVLAIICLSMSSYAVGMSCSIVTDYDIANIHECSDGAIIFTISDLADGGSHALPDGEAGAFPKVVCCEGVTGLTASVEFSPHEATPGSFDKFVGYFANGHFNRTGSFSVFSKSLWLESPTDIDCSYQKADENCAGYETCLFSISEDSAGYSHVSGCGTTEYPFNNANNYRYCCKQGAASCDITDRYWGMFDETTGEIIKIPEPLVCPVGVNMPVFIFADTSNCESAVADFTLYDSSSEVYVSPADLHDTPIPIGKIYFEGTLYDADTPSTVGAFWRNAGEGIADDYKFKAVLTSTDPVFTTASSYSPDMEVSGSCRAENPITPCATTITEAQIAQCTDKCSGDPSTCPDTDCDRVADCIDDIVITPANCEEVDECTGVPRGTAGCVPAMDCTNLLWSECKNCEAEQDCDTVGGFEAGTMYMERCVGLTEEECKCMWIGAAPPECTPAVLNQYDNRFKECIEDEEFPFFDGFNVIAVLLVLSIYYAIIIVRKKN